MRAVARAGVRAPGLSRALATRLPKASRIADIAITLADLTRRWPEAVTPFQAGYAQVRPWPEMSPNVRTAFAAARDLDVMNLGLNLRRPGIAGFLGENSRRIVGWMRAG